MATRTRKLPPLASDADRIEAARIAADHLTAYFRESDLIRASWQEKPIRWNHYIDSVGGITSVLED